MDWLKKLPVAGPWFGRLMRTHAWRAYERLETVHWARLAAAITFLSFVAVFPLVTVGAAIAAALLSDAQARELQGQLADRIPGISDQLRIDDLVANAGTVGLIAGALLLFTGISWVGSLRECLRAVWQKEEDPGNPFLLKAKDGAVLIGLGAVGLLALGGSAFASSAVGRVADRIGLTEGGIGRVLLLLAGIAIAVLANFLLFVYVLTRLPQVTADRRAVIVAGLIGAAGFELFKWLLGGYLQSVAGKNMYGAFGLPIALMLWINFMAKLLLFCSAWTATQHTYGTPEAMRPETGEEAAERGTGPGAGAGDTDGSRGPGGASAARVSPSGPGGPAPGAASDGAPADRPRPAPPAHRP